MARGSRQVKSWPLQHRERDSETLRVSWQKQPEQLGFDCDSYFFKYLYIMLSYLKLVSGPRSELLSEGQSTKKSGLLDRDHYLL